MPTNNVKVIWQLLSLTSVGRPQKALRVLFQAEVVT